MKESTGTQKASAPRSSLNQLRCLRNEWTFTRGLKLYHSQQQQVGSPRNARQRHSIPRWRTAPCVTIRQAHALAQQSLVNCPDHPQPRMLARSANPSTLHNRIVSVAAQLAVSRHRALRLRSTTQRCVSLRNRGGKHDVHKSHHT